MTDTLPAWLADLLDRLPSAISAAAVIVVAFIGLAVALGSVLNLLQKDDDDD